LAQLALTLHPDKTRLIQFSRRAAEERERAGLGKPETFDFLGFTHISGKTRAGRFALKRKTIAKRMRTKLREVKAELMRRMHLPIPVVGRWLGSVVRGHMAYYAVPGNIRAVRAFRTQVTRHWRAALQSRSQRGYLNWNRMNRLAARWLPPPPHPAPLPRRALPRSHPRQEPSALAAHAGICAGGRPQGRSLPRSPVQIRPPPRAALTA